MQRLYAGEIKNFSYFFVDWIVLYRIFMICQFPRFRVNLVRRSHFWMR
jgi:hypothetical protein